MTEKSKKPEYEFPVEDMAYLVKALLAEGLEIRRVSCSLHVGNIVQIMEFDLVDDELTPEPDPMMVRTTQ